MIDLNHGPCIYKRIAGCGSGTEYFAVTPQGGFYPCHQFVGDEAYRMGNIWDGVTNTDMQEKFRKCNVYSRRECDDCWARLYCSGGCAANALPRVRRHQWRLRIRLRAIPQAHGVRDHAEDRRTWHFLTLY